MTSAQVRMARAALNWTVRDLAKATGLHRNTITNIEVGRYAGDAATLAKIERVLRRAGVEFIDENGEGLECASESRCGSRLRTKTTNRHLRAWAGSGARRASRGRWRRPSWTMRLPDRSSGSTSPRFSRQAKKGGLVVAHDDPRVRAADEVAAIGSFDRESCDLSGR